jgi:hypothetical protein
MSPESQAIFYRELDNYRQAVAKDPDANPTALKNAAWGHTGASRPLGRVIADYEQAMLNPRTPAEHAAAQKIADELGPIRMATEIAAGNLPFRGHTVTTG